MFGGVALIKFVVMTSNSKIINKKNYECETSVQLTYYLKILNKRNGKCRFG